MVGEPRKQEIVNALLETHGRTDSEESGVDLSMVGPSAQFRWLCASLLLSARIKADIALNAARALVAKRWTTPTKMAESIREEPARTRNQAGYARYDQRTSTIFGDHAELLLEKSAGDQRKPREAERERKLLKESKGIGDVGAEIFFREMQMAWEELASSADKKALEATKKLGMDGDPVKLTEMARQARAAPPRLLAALVRCGLFCGGPVILRQAGRS